ncbi:phage tail tape measure protein [Arundinibacter roseus]|uniref:Phage tail tape measure protein n=1 Tax=Arundinibacter roseus TaxID=2070510 RepID=A0A4R4KLH5_9BACT|nr:phage tail tape measure protein [Arundinibacter roseus]TDB69118.1 phage tail tape measure protein [Arundinibacter roseus]
MQLVENSIWNLDINGKPALNALGELEQKLLETKKAQEDLKRGTKEWAESQKEIKALEAEIKKVRETMGLAGMTVKQLEGYAKQLGKEIKDLTPGTDDYIKKTEELKQVNTRLSSVRKDVRAVAEEADNSKGTWGRMKDWIMGAFVVTAIVEAGRMIGQFVGDSIEHFKKFQSASAELSANTKITGNELKYLEEQAKKLGPQMGKTGDEMLAAYQLMGSAKSDLTENAESLAAVTREAIILSQAGKIELAPATELMAGALNQFNAPASDAGRFINAIAAGAQVGSAEISDMTSALKASGTVANAANVSFEQTNGALQSLSTINIKGEQAGTMFRNTLIKLMSSADDLNPQIVGLDKSLENLSARKMSTAELAKMFGTENVVAAQHLMNHRDQVAEFTEALTGTDEAYKMAAINNETLEARQKQSEATTANLGVALGEKLNPFIIKAYDAFGVFQEVMGNVIDSSTPLFDSFMMLWDVLSNLFGSVGKVISAFFGLDEKTNGTKVVMQTLSVIFGIVAAAAAGLVLVLQTIIDGLLFLDGKITFEQLKTNAVNSFNTIKAGLKSTFVDQFKEIEAPAVAAQADLTKKQGDARAEEEKKTIDKIVNTETATHAQGLTKKEEAAQKHRDSEQAKAKAKAEKEEADRVKANETANKAIEKMAIDAITDDTARKKKLLEYELNEKLANNAKSKADDLTKVNYEIALRAKFKADTEKLEADARAKALAEETKKLNAISRLEEQLRTERLNQEYATTKSILEHALTNERLTIQQRQRLKLDLIELERQNELRKIEDIARAERAKAVETSNQLIKLAGDDADKKKQILSELDTTIRGIDAKLIADKNAANAKHNAETRDTERKSLEERKANQESFFSMLKGLLKGDFDAFNDFLNKKLQNEKAMQDERLQGWTGKTMEILNIVKGGLEVLSAANELYLTMQINRNNRERDDKIKKLQQQYQKGLIDKVTYETGLANINEQADEKEKQLKLKAWRRDQAGQIAMAVINGAAAALKSLATMGWPLGLVGVAAAAATTVAQIAMIKRQQPPTFAQGGKIRNGGVPEGPAHGSSYGQSGIALIRRDTGDEVGEMEGGEPILILSRNTYKNNGKVIDKLLNSSLHRNGAPVFAEKGALFGSDGGDYRDFLEPMKAGQMYLFGSKKRKEYDKKMKEQYDADMAAKAEMESYMNYDYGDYGADDYGAGSDYGDGSGFDSGVDFGDGGDYSEGFNGNEYQDVGDADATVGATNAQIQASQNMMAAIARNTAQTVKVVTELADATKGMSGKIDQLIGAANRTADNAGAAAAASNRAAEASNRAADVTSMAIKNDL